MKVFSPKNPKSIQKMFEVLAPTYDHTNTTISLGVHHLWKKKLIQKSCLRPGDSLLDCATGTGDIAFGFESTFKKMGTIIAIDFCEPMLVEARKKALKKKSKVVFEWADIMHLP
jgi:demethylmenaquinone methyltransferase/2-methoxy-6-polyprenyl-1,4-benzoquinol methylase